MLELAPMGVERGWMAIDRLIKNRMLTDAHQLDQVTILGRFRVKRCTSCPRRAKRPASCAPIRALPPQESWHMMPIRRVAVLVSLADIDIGVVKAFSV